MIQYKRANQLFQQN